RLPAVPVGDEPHRRAPRRSLSVHPRRPLSRLGTTASSVPENSLHRPPEDCSSAILISVMPITKLIDMPDRSGKDISRCSKPNASPSGQSRRPLICRNEDPLMTTEHDETAAEGNRPSLRARKAMTKRHEEEHCILVEPKSN